MMMLGVEHVAKRYREDELSQSRMADTTYRRLWMHVYSWTMHRDTSMTSFTGPGAIIFVHTQVTPILLLPRDLSFQAP